MSAFFSAALRLGIITAAAFGLGAASACSSDSTDDGRVQVVTTLPLFADFIENVGGDRVEVTALLPRGADPHTWEPSPKDVQKVEEADVAFVNGMDLEPAATEIIEANLRDGVPVVRLAEEAIYGLEVKTDDPHLWMNPGYAFAYMSNIRDGLIEADGAGVEDYWASFTAYAAVADDAAGYLDEEAGKVPDEQRKLITTHAAFGHLADYIDFEITAFVAAGPGQDTSPDDIRAIVEAVEEQGVPAVFSEPQISGESETLKQIADDTGAEVCTLYSDSLDDEVSTYIELVRFNADEIAQCLGGVDGD